MTATTDFVVNLSNYGEHKWVDGPDPSVIALGEGQILVEVEKFAMTANNITYAVVGEMLGYWAFFPTGEAGWGRIPSWGFAKVVRSNCGGIPVGTRFFGFLPMSSHLLMQPVNITANGFLDHYEHRKDLHDVYNSYSLLDEDRTYSAKHENAHPIFRPLFTTGFLIDDFLADNAFFGAEQVLLLSASSKTALGTAFCTSLRSPKPARIIGATSPGNLAFVEGLAGYDSAVTYGNLTSLDRNVPTVIVDYAGDGDLVATLHHHFGDNVKYNCIVGKSHSQGGFTPPGLPGADPVMFFAPDQAQKRMGEWGRDEFNERLNASWQAFLQQLDTWLTLKYSEGKDAVATVYEEVLAGKINPAEGHILAI